MFSTKYKKEIEELKMELHKKNCDNIDLKYEIEEYKIELFKMTMKYNAWECEYTDERHRYGEKGYILSDGEGANVYISVFFVLNSDVNYLVEYIEKEFDSCHHNVYMDEDIKKLKKNVDRIKNLIMLNGIHPSFDGRKLIIEHLDIVQKELDKLTGIEKCTW